MKKFFSFLFLLGIVLLGNTQDPHVIFLKNKPLSFQPEAYYISKVFAQKFHKKSIGTTRVEDKNKPSDSYLSNVVLSQGLENSIYNFYKSVLPIQDKKHPVQVHVRELRVWENYSQASEVAFVYLEFDFYIDSKKAYTSYINHSSNGIDATQLIEKNLTSALKEALYDFNQHYWLKIPKDTTNPMYQQPIKASKNDPDLPTDIYFSRKMANTIGYQIGGYNLIGIDIEARLSDAFGIHGGVGYIGYTAGIKFHFTPALHGPLINLSYKDGGFGLISAFAAEFSTIIRLSTNTGIVFQIGVAKINQIDREFSRALFNSSRPNYMLSGGIGFGF